MKGLWTAISIFAVMNMLALAGLAAWLVVDDRVSAERLQEVRELFMETVAATEARQAAAAADAEEARLAAEEEERLSQPPIPAADVLAVRIEQSKADTVRLEGLRREVEVLQETLRRERSALDAARAEFAREKASFERARETVARTEGDAQFRKTLATYEGLKPDRARLAFEELIRQGETEQVVAYLNAMQERTRTRIIDEFLKDDPAVATDLLERLRTRGLAARGSEDGSG